MREFFKTLTLFLLNLMTDISQLFLLRLLFVPKMIVFEGYYLVSDILLIEKDKILKEFMIKNKYFKDPLKRDV